MKTRETAYDSPGQGQIVQCSKNYQLKKSSIEAVHKDAIKRLNQILSAVHNYTTKSGHMIR